MSFRRGRRPRHKGLVAAAAVAVAGEVEVWQSGRRLMLIEVPGAPAAVRAPIDAAFAAVCTPIEWAAAGRVVTVDVETTDRVVGLTVSVTDDGLLVVAAPPGVWLPDQRGGWLLSALYVAQDRLGLRIEQLRGIVLQ